MVGKPSGDAPDQTSARGPQDELLLQAVTVLRRRYEEGGDRWGVLPPSATAELGDTLSGLATAPQVPEGVDRDEALALAHRLMDDDHPELSPMWPRSVG
jgi:hypothetical protein